VSQILRNRIKCSNCNDVITSRHVHDYVTCSCGSVSTDGGLMYCRRGWEDGASYEDMSVYDDGKHETRREALEWGKNYSKEGVRLPETKYVKISEMDDDHICNILNQLLYISKIYKQTFEDEIIWREEQLMTQISTKG
jgi:hypothetical protein